MTAYAQAPVGAVYRNPLTGSVYVKTVPEPGAAWVAVARGHSAGRVTSAAMERISGLVEMKDVTS